MAQLHATVDEIQLTKRMIIADTNTTLTTALENWTDEEYPSALAVAELINKTVPDRVEHPIGSVVITSTNENPGASIGGTWTMIDKEYKNEYKAIPNTIAAWTSNNATAGGGIIRANHEISIKVWLVTTAALSKNNTIGEFSRALCGVKDTGSFTLSNEGGIAYAVGPNDESYIIRYILNGGGTLSIDEIVENKTLPIGTTIHFHTIVPMTKDDMADGFCDKFYWKRTA